MNFAGHHITTTAMLLFALGLFFAAGVYSAIRQGIKLLAVLALVAAVLAFTAGVLRL